MAGLGWETVGLGPHPLVVVYYEEFVSLIESP